MISASKEFKEKLKKGADCVNYADIALSNGTVLNLEPKDFMIGGCSIDDKTSDGKFGVGFVIGKTLSMRIANYDERFSQYDFYNSVITLYIALLLDDGTIEKIRKGVYYATIPSTPGDTIEISAVDGIYRLDKDYSASTTVYPATLQTIISDACLDCGIPIGFTTFDNMNFIVQEKPESVTYRQVVSYAAQIAGYNARIDKDGYMQLIWYNTNLLGLYNYVGGDFKIYPHETVIDGGNFTDYSSETVISGGNFADEIPEHIYQFKTLSVHTDDVQITGVRVIGEDDATALFGEDGYLIEVASNPFVYGREQEIADYLGNRMVGMIFRPFTAQILNNPLHEPFEVIRISDRKGNTYISIINSVSYTIGSYTQISCEAEDPVRNGSSYFSESAVAVVEARRNAEKHLTTYDKAVQNMNQLAMNALGYHTTYEDQPDGSRITYLHNKPELSESTVIYKQTIDGFFISTDGGKSYTAGFDKNGNVVVNILYAIGIVCDWIRGGTLTLGGTDNVNGKIQVLDAEGNIICQITKDGLISKLGNLNSDIETIGTKVIQNEKSISAEVKRATEAEGNLSASISVNEGNISAEAKRATDSEVELAGAISVAAEQIKIKVSRGEVSAQLSVESEQVTIKGNRFVLESDNCSISSNGTIKASNVDLSGKIKALSGEIGGFTIGSSSIHTTAASILGGVGVYLGTDGFSCNGILGTIILKSDGSAKFETSDGIKIYYGTTNYSYITSNGIKIKNSSYTDTTYTEKSIDCYSSFTINAYNGLTIDTKSIGNRNVKIAAGSLTYADFGTTTSYIYGGDSGISVGRNGGKLGFFGNDGATKKSITSISSTSSATAAANAAKINEILTALKAYNLIG